MDHGKVLLGIVAVVAVYQVWVSVQLVRASHLEPLQKLLQLGLVWLIPAVGAIIVQSMLAVEGKAPYVPEKGYTEPSGSNGDDRGM
jgi:hypothetical protein